MRVADYIAKFVADQGVTDVFVLTGNGAMYLNDGLVQEPRLKYFCARNEGAAPMMAEAYGRLSRKVGVVCVTSGPGSTNSIPGLAEAYVDSAPVLILSGQVPTHQTTRHANIPGLRTFGNAEIDIVEVVKSLTKYAVMVTDSKTIRYHMERAFYEATSGRPGPVWLDIPMDVQAAEIDPDKLEGFTPPKPALNIVLDDLVEKTAQLLLAAKNPLLVCGHGIRQGKAIGDFKKLVDLLQAPLVSSRLGQDVMPHSHPCHMGYAGIKASKYCAKIMRQADVVLSLGCRLAIPFVGVKQDAFAKNAKIVMVDLSEAELKKPGVPLHLAVQVDVKDFIPKLIQRLSLEKLPNWSGWLHTCQDIKERNPMVLPEQKRDPIDLYYFMSRIDALSGANHVLTTDAGSNYYVGGQTYRFEKGQREITSGAFAAMGLSIPLAIGSAVAQPEKQILAVTGDGSLELNIQELKTMSYYKLNIKLFVINNGGYLSMRRWQDDFFEGRRIGSDDQTGAETLNLKNIAQAFDLKYDCIQSYKEIDEKLKQIIATDGPLFVEVICDSKQKVIESMHIEDSQ